MEGPQKSQCGNWTLKIGLAFLSIDFPDEKTKKRSKYKFARAVKNKREIQGKHFINGK